MTSHPRIPFGLDRLPRAIGADDPRLPAAPIDVGPLRLNTEPVPPAAMLEEASDHAARVAAVINWLAGQCGDYAPLRRRFIIAYFAVLATQIDTHRTALAADLAGYDGLYAPDDWLWSALRPLPRAWLAGSGGPIPAEIAFWDGTQPLAIELSVHDTSRQAALAEAGVTVLRIPPDAVADPAALGGLLPAPFHIFWRGQNLPASPFRRPIPRGVLGATTAGAATA
jgi:hypothetical protein